MDLLLYPGRQLRDDQTCGLGRACRVDVAGHGLEPNATLTLTITDVKSGQTVLPETRVTTNSSGSFTREYDMDLAKHPSLLANLYESNGNTLVLAASRRRRSRSPGCWRRATKKKPRATAATS